MSDQLQSQIAAASVESGAAMGAAEKKGESQFNDLFKLNQVYYQLPPSLSLVSKRTMTRCQFQQTSYSNPASGAPATAIFNTGEFQVSGPTSFLVIQAGIDLENIAVLDNDAKKSSTHAFLTQGGILNIIEEIIFTSASGTEVCREQNKGLQSAVKLRNTLPQQFYDTAGELEGFPGGTMRQCYDTLGWMTHAGSNTVSSWNIPTRSAVYQDPGRSLAGGAADSYYDKVGGPGPVGSVDLTFSSTPIARQNNVAAQAMYFVVPLSRLLGCFNPYMKALIPSQMLAGGRIDIRWKNFNEAITVSGPIITTSALAQTLTNALQIYNIYFMLDSFQMNDSTIKRLNEIAVGQEGLTMTFDTIDWAQTATTILSFEAQVAQARSRVIRSYCIIRDNLEIQNPFGNSLASEAAVKRPNGYVAQYNYSNVGNNSLQQLVNNYQAVLGSLYFPQQPLTTIEEQCMNVYYTFCKNYCSYDELSPITRDEFMGANGAGQFNNGAIVVPVSVAVGGVTNALRDSSTTVPGWQLNWGSATFGFLAERSQLLQLTGLPLSNARLLRHRFTLNYPAASGLGRQIDVFTEYTRVSKIFLGGRIVIRE